MATMSFFVFRRPFKPLGLGHGFFEGGGTPQEGNDSLVDPR